MKDLSKKLLHAFKMALMSLGLLEAHVWPDSKPGSPFSPRCRIYTALFGSCVARTGAIA